MKMLNENKIPFRRAIRRSISEISKIKSERTRIRVTSAEGKLSSPDCEVETGTEDDSGTMKVYLA